MASFKETRRPLLFALLALLLSPPPSRALESLSQFGQDAFIINAVYGNSRAGSAGSAGSARYFIELGAVDGFEFSNTLSLERDLGWRGLCIEPSAMYHELVASNRTYVTSKRNKRTCACASVCVLCVAGVVCVCLERYLVHSVLVNNAYALKPDVSSRLTRCVKSDACVGPRSGDTVRFVEPRQGGEGGARGEGGDGDSEEGGEGLAEIWQEGKVVMRMRNGQGVFSGMVDYLDKFQVSGAVTEKTTTTLEAVLDSVGAPGHIDYLR